MRQLHLLMEYDPEALPIAILEEADPDTIKQVILQISSQVSEGLMIAQDLEYNERARRWEWDFDCENLLPPVYWEVLSMAFFPKEEPDETP